MALKEIAATEHVTVPAIRECLMRAYRYAGKNATPGSTLPEGLAWERRSPGRWPEWYVSIGSVSQEVARWAMRLTEASEQGHSCECCGRPL